MEHIWKTKYPDTENNNFDLDRMIYVYNGNSIKVGRFDYHHCSIFIHDLIGEQIDWNFYGCGAWCCDLKILISLFFVYFLIGWIFCGIVIYNTKRCRETDRHSKSH